MALATLTIAGPVATLCMHDPARRNALSASMLAELSAALGALPPATRVVVLRAGPGDPVWCAGFDIGALSPGRDPLSPDGALQGLFRRIDECPAPVIGMLHGSAWGGGTDLALRCDMLIGDHSASLAFTPAKLGLPYDQSGLLNAMLRAGPALAFEMFATAEPVSAERALAAGLLNRLVPSGSLEAETNALAHRIARNAPLVVSSAKQHFRALAATLPLAGGLGQALDDGRNRALESDDYREGLRAFREKRAPDFNGR